MKTIEKLEIQLSNKDVIEALQDYCARKQTEINRVVVVPTPFPPQLREPDNFVWDFKLRRNLRDGIEGLNLTASGKGKE